jgi:AcrR family transcriptional regulator
MPRPQRFSEDGLLDAALALVAENGPGALSMTAVADRAGAPSGSVYYRFDSRDVLAATLWVRTVERFQDEWHHAVDHPDPLTAVRQAAHFVVAWCRANTAAARLLLLYRSTDLTSSDWPEALRLRNDAQRQRYIDTVNDLCKRLGARSASQRRRVWFATTDLPLAAVRSAVAEGRAPENLLDTIVDDAVTAVMDGLKQRRRP